MIHVLLLTLDIKVSLLNNNTFTLKSIAVFLLLAVCFSNSVKAQNSVSHHASIPIKEPAWVKNDKKGPQNQENKVKWTRDPFDHQVFIENKGQYDTDVNGAGKVLYQVMLGGVKAYFTASGVYYKYVEGDKPIQKRDLDELKDIPKPIIHNASYTWAGANANVTIDAKEEQTYYYTFPTSSHSSIKVNIFKKIVYHDIYPGIDIEYSFIDGKPGIKYSVIVHPGADISLIKLHYSGTPNLHIDKDGDAIAQTDVGEITDHTPVCYYQSGGQHVTGAYRINGSEESFTVNAIAGSTENLVIDPWTTDPLFTGPGYDDAFDVDYDQHGNVYAYGSYTPFQLTKFNAAGVQQWTFNATTISYNYGAGGFYGDFAVDKITGTSYLVEGYGGGGAAALKVDALGNLLLTYPGSATMNEMWRCTYNGCTRQIVIGGGGTNTPSGQAALLDTNMVTITSQNPLGTGNGGHDVCLIAMDPTGSTVFMGLPHDLSDPAFNNVIMSLPVPALNPANYITGPDGFNFQEIQSILYAPPLSGYSAINGMNGLAASPNWLYSYDGATLNKINKATGANVASTAVTGTS
ncbi:MAG TPA: hypothetical protein VNY36_05335, partial [Bacteroidia bacterium]|nr:hypothetical protein [Bacteroidia bacterium]